MMSNIVQPHKLLGAFFTWGILWLVLAILGAAAFFADGMAALLEAWKLPEYSHGPLIPVLSGLLFLRQLKTVPINTDPVRDYRIGLVVLIVALAMGALGKLANITDIVAYALILWVAGILLVSFGWKQGRQFWPPVLHLIYMLPLPDVVYYKLSIFLQFISSELGVMFLHGLQVPVFLEGNIIDLGVYKLQVAEACSGLRYLFPILSFSYIFSVLYKGPIWHKAVLLVSAVPIVVLMNSVRIAVAGYIVNAYGLEWVEGATHFFEGWVIFMISIILLFILARILLMFQPVKMGLADSLDLSFDGIGAQFARLRLVEASRGMVVAALMMVGASLAWQALPDRTMQTVDRESFALFPRDLGNWQQVGTAQSLGASVVVTLGADDYRSVTLAKPGVEAGVGLFMAWYDDQSQGGTHSPEICLPGGGWEIAWLERTDIAAQVGADAPFNINRVIIQKGETRMMVYYWFDQKGRKIAWDFAAKFWLLVDGIRTGRTDGALVRLTTIMLEGETEFQAEARLADVVKEIRHPLPRFIPNR